MIGVLGELATTQLPGIPGPSHTDRWVRQIIKHAILDAHSTLIRVAFKKVQLNGRFEMRRCH
jgi:hypothetical protein